MQWAPRGLSAADPPPYRDETRETTVDCAFRGRRRERDRRPPQRKRGADPPGRRSGERPRSAPGANLREPGNRREQHPGSGPAGAAAFRFRSSGAVGALGGSRGRRKGCAPEISPGSAVPCRRRRRLRGLARGHRGLPAGSGEALPTGGWGPGPRWASHPRKESPSLPPVFGGPPGTGVAGAAVAVGAPGAGRRKFRFRGAGPRIPDPHEDRSEPDPRRFPPPRRRRAPAGSGAVALPAGGWRPYGLSGPRTG